MFAGSFFIEDTFDYPGLGDLLLKSIGTRDYPVMAGAFLLITVTIIVANILADLCYTLIDPRVRH
jgi:peptide/nickel transport system permease protein